MIHLVEIPEEEKFSSGRRRRGHVTKQIRVGIPKHAIEAQNNFVQITESQTRDGRLNRCKMMERMQIEKLQGCR